MSRFSSRLAVQNEALEYYIDEQLAWTTPIDAILLIAEYTTNAGPYVDDYFIQLWSLEDGVRLRATITFYSDGRDDAFRELATQMKADLSFGLLGSTEWDSRILWPPPLSGHKYFAFREIKPVTWKEKLSHRFFGPSQEYFLTEEAQAFLKTHIAGG